MNDVSPVAAAINRTDNITILSPPTRFCKASNSAVLNVCVVTICVTGALLPTPHQPYCNRSG